MLESGGGGGGDVWAEKDSLVNFLAFEAENEEIQKCIHT